MNLQEQILRSEELVKQLAEGINHQGLNLKEAEQKILEHINRIGQIMVDEVVQQLKEPVTEN